MNRINLLPDRFIESRRRRRAARLTVVGGVALGALAAVWGGVAYAQVSRISVRLAAAEAQLAAERVAAQAQAVNEREAGRLRDMLAFRGQLEAPASARGVLALATHLLPESVALTRLSLEAPPANIVDPSKAPPARPGATPAAQISTSTRVELEGLALRDVEVAQVVGLLAQQEAFTNVKLVRSRQLSSGGVTRFGFLITLEVPPAIAAPATAGAPATPATEKTTASVEASDGH